MKNRIITILITLGATTLIFSPLIYIAYRLGYCNACDKYIGASECKPRRKLNFFGN